MSKQLNALWNAYRDTPFTTFSIQRTLDLSTNELTEILNLLKRMSDTGETQNRYRIKRVASTMYKLIQTQANESDSIPLPTQKELLTAQIRESVPDQTPEKSVSLPLTEQKLGGLVSTSTEQLTRPEQKTQASKQLTAWDYQEHRPKAWIQLIDEGETICTGHFNPDDDGVYSHQRHLWQGTHLICTDADVFKQDNNDAPLQFQEPNRLIELYPTLTREAFAVGHSLSSLSKTKPPPHVRARITFLTELRIDAESFSDFMRGLAQVYPIINPSLPPSQPVFGNAGHRRYVEGDTVKVDKSQQFTSSIFGNVLPADQVIELVAKGKQLAEQAQNTAATAHGNINSYDGETQELTIWLAKHNIPILGQRTGPCQNRGFATMYLVTCPWENEHTESFGAKDTAVFVDPPSEQWAFHCFHEHCARRGWNDFRQAIAPNSQHTTKHQHSPTKRRLLKTRQLYGGKR